MKIVAEPKPELMEDGKHIGVVVRVEYREEPYKYTDIYIKPEGKAIELKYGCPTKIHEETKLGKVLREFTGEIVPGVAYDPEKILLNRRVYFMTQIEKTGEGQFVKVVNNSIKPVP